MADETTSNSRLNDWTPDFPLTSDEELIRLQEWEGRIRREALEEAARVLEREAAHYDEWDYAMLKRLAAAIRALKEKE